MPRSKLAIPAERRKMQLKNRLLEHKIRIASSKEAVQKIKAELGTMTPKRKREDPIP